MSTRTNIRPQPVVVSESMAADITSDVTILQSLTRAGYTVSWSGTSPIGDLYVEVSNDYALDLDGRTVKTAGNWVAIALTDDTGTVVTSIPVSGNTGKKFIDVDGTAAYAIRLFYDRTSGTGTMNATINAKVS